MHAPSTAAEVNQAMTLAASSTFISPAAQEAASTGTKSQEEHAHQPPLGSRGPLTDLSLPQLLAPPLPTQLQLPPFPSSGDVNLQQHLLGSAAPLVWTMRFRDRVLQSAGLLIDAPAYGGGSNSDKPLSLFSPLLAAAAAGGGGEGGGAPLAAATTTTTTTDGARSRINHINHTLLSEQFTGGDSEEGDYEDEEEMAMGHPEQGRVGNPPPGGGMGGDGLMDQLQGGSLSSPSSRSKRGRPSSSSGLTLQEKNRR